MTVIIQIICFTRIFILVPPILLQDVAGEPTGISSVQWLNEVILAGFFLMILLLFYKAGNRILKSELENHDKIKTISSELEKLRKEVGKIPMDVSQNPTEINMPDNTNEDVISDKALQNRSQEKSETIGISDTMVSGKELSALEEDQPSQVFDLEIKKELNNNILYFLGSPDKEKAFYAPEATEDARPNTLYVIEDTTLNLYDRINSQTMKAAMNSVEIHIKRVCEIVNIKEPQHTKLVMLAPGEVTKENDDFLVIKKIKVKFD